MLLTYPAHLILLDFITLILQIMTLLVTQSSPASCYLLPFK